MEHSKVQTVMTQIFEGLEITGLKIKGKNKSSIFVISISKLYKKFVKWAISYRCNSSIGINFSHDYTYLCSIF